MWVNELNLSAALEKKGCTVFITGIIQGQISYLTCYFREINGTERLMRINATLNVIIKSCVSLSYCRFGGDTFLLQSFFFCLGRSLAEEFPLSLFSCRRWPTFWEKGCNGFYWSSMAQRRPRAGATMPSAPSNSISKCCDSGAVQEAKVVNIPQQLRSSFQRLVKAVVGVSDCDELTSFAC